MENAILIVEGDEAFREMLVDFFVKREMTVIGCDTYDEARKISALRQFDIAVVDYFIGEECGEDLCGLLQAHHAKETALIITSDRQSPTTERRIRMQAPAYYFVKPFAIDNLYAVVLRILEFREKKNKLLRCGDVLHSPTAKPGRNMRTRTGNPPAEKRGKKVSAQSRRVRSVQSASRQRQSSNLGKSSAR
jgi:DNA-binding response OmpR family regulator